MTEDVSSRSLALLGAAAIAAGLLGMAVVQHNGAITASGGMDAHIHMIGADAEEGATARPATTVKPLTCEKLPNVPGHSITTALVEFPPNAYTPRHRHPGSVTAFVIKGALRSQMEGSPAVTYTQGQTWFEAPGAIHAFAENASATEPAELLAIFVAEDDCGPLTIPVPD
ncbi:cupin domain-containing protein [Mesorhizobium sp. VK25A]|uniref:Cupin domain-containing protein n=1 Tax=Mesorhizobium vachelliae TaxID=3072309 RepID=A0ABU4ZYC6_9HYPH|nr:MULTISPECIES: cupin domain-containing protein [unclassified Mesorhizobium]MDX8530416.1 cupin domain-containing protein [Mesorhizobium sp. VK25D]MDX8542393.1 cupin domain-containing protein [Mesorhizobium sp. VK25A]